MLIVDLLHIDIIVIWNTILVAAIKGMVREECYVYINTLISFSDNTLNINLLLFHVYIQKHMINTMYIVSIEKVL